MEPGDIVRLKSGGPPMTVASIENENVCCFWFAGNERFRQRMFPQVTLVSDGPEIKMFDAPETVEIAVGGDGGMGTILARSLETQRQAAVQKLEELKPLLRDD